MSNVKFSLTVIGLAATIVAAMVVVGVMLDPSRLAKASPMPATPMLPKGPPTGAHILVIEPGVECFRDAPQFIYCRVEVGYCGMMIDR